LDANSENLRGRGVSRSPVTLPQKISGRGVQTPGDPTFENLKGGRGGGVRIPLLDLRMYILIKDHLLFTYLNYRPLYFHNMVDYSFKNQNHRYIITESGEPEEFEQLDDVVHQ
jgi:hypothetical protein